MDLCNQGLRDKRQNGTDVRTHGNQRAEEPDHCLQSGYIAHTTGSPLYPFMLFIPSYQLSQL